ncbi:MAG: hypothetical protein ACTSU5_00070 [Promethearchaeota archaeon]
MENKMAARRDEQEGKYFDVLSKGPLPFEKHVSRGTSEDLVDIPTTHKRADARIGRAIRGLRGARTAKFFPLIGEAGAGKTHYYWCLKSKADAVLGQGSGAGEEPDPGARAGSGPRSRPRSQSRGSLGDTPYLVVYVPSPPAPVQIMSHLLTCVLDECGDRVVDDLSRKVVGEFYRPGDGFRDVLRRASRRFRGFHADVVKALLYYGLPPDVVPRGVDREVVENWLLCESISGEQVSKLGLRPNVEEDEGLVFSYLRLILNQSSYAFVLYFDEMELIYRVHGPDAEVAYWEVIKQVYNNCEVVIVTTCLGAVWKRVLENLDPTVTSRFEAEVHLEPFTLPDLYALYRLTMAQYWSGNGLEYPGNPYYPLDEQGLAVIHEKAKGNPRQVIRFLHDIFEKVADGEVPRAVLSPPEAETGVVGKGSAVEFGEGQLLRAGHGAPAPGAPAEGTFVHVAVGDEEYDMELSPTTMVSSASMVLRHATALLEGVEAAEGTVELNRKVKLKRVVTTLPLVFLSEKGETVGLVVPQWRHFAQRGKGDTYYALVTITDALRYGQVDRGVLIVPKTDAPGESRGPDLSGIFPEFKSRLAILEFTEEEAIQFVEAAFQGTGAGDPFPDVHLALLGQKYTSMGVEELRALVREKLGENPEE